MRVLTPVAHCLAAIFVFFTAISALGQSSQPLSAALSADGSLRTDATGSFDPKGYKLSFGPNGEPRFSAAPSQPLGTTCNDGWENLGFSIDGVDGGIYSVVADGSGNVYIGGDFSAVHNVGAGRIAKWNGTAWSSLGFGVAGRIEAIAVSGTDVYVAGIFETAGGVAARNVAKWNGSAWSALGPGVGGQNTQSAHAIAVSGTDVYAGGDFGIQRWDGASWSGLGSTTGPEGSVHAIAVSGSDVYIGGFFIFAGGISSPGIVKFNGTSWSPLGAGLGRTSGSPQVEVIVISGSDVYVGGTFDSAGGNPTSNVAKWNGTSWSALGAGISGGRVTALTVSGTDLYAGGFFAVAGGSVANRIAKWNGAQWSALGSGLDTTGSIVEGIAVLGSNLVVGGSFATAGGSTANGLAIWTGSSWTTFAGNNSLSSIVRGVAVSGTDVYVVGNFTKAGSLTVNNVAKWNGSTWSALGTGVPGGFLNSVAVSGNNVYVGGNFSNAGGVNANNIARWNGTNWSQLGSGVSSGVVAVITVSGEDVYVGGSFTTAGGNAANKIAKWNGTSWSGFNSAIISGPVTTIAPAGDVLYVGAGTTTADSPNYFLKYDGTTWTGLGNGMTNGGVSSIAVSGNDVYVAGGFTSVGGVPGTMRIAKWNNGTWSALGSGLPPALFLSNQVRIAMAGSELIAVGDFRTGAGGPGDHIARWNGSAWLPMGAGLNATGTALSVAGGDVYVGGEFTTAGCYLSPYFARWRQNVWTGSTSTDWHNGANWGSGTVAAPNTGVTISANNATISSADVTVSSLIVTNGRNLAIAAGRTLTVTGNLEINNGAITGPGTLIVNGNVQLNGDIFGVASVTINGGLTLNAGRIDGGPVILTSCSVGALGGGSSTAFIQSSLTRCVNSTGTFRFPVGTGSPLTGYGPVELSGISGSGNFTVAPRSGGYPGVVTGLSANRLQRWWDFSNDGITQAIVTFNYNDADVVGLEHRYRIFRINGGIATQIPTTLNQATNRATTTPVTTFSPWTLAEGQPEPRTLSGRVTTASRGAWGVIVSLTDSQGNTRYAVTNPFGYYRFTNVLTFQVYTVRVAHKKFTFPTPERSVDLDEFTGTINFQSSDN